MSFSWARPMCNESVLCSVELVCLVLVIRSSGRSLVGFGCSPIFNPLVHCSEAREEITVDVGEFRGDFRENCGSSWSCCSRSMTCRVHCCWLLCETMYYLCRGGDLLHCLWIFLPPFGTWKKQFSPSWQGPRPFPPFPAATMEASTSTSTRTGTRAWKREEGRWHEKSLFSMGRYMCAVAKSFGITIGGSRHPSLSVEQYSI